MVIASDWYWYPLKLWNQRWGPEWVTSAILDLSYLIWDMALKWPKEWTMVASGKCTWIQGGATKRTQVGAEEDLLLFRIILCSLLWLRNFSGILVWALQPVTCHSVILWIPWECIWPGAPRLDSEASGGQHGAGSRDGEGRREGSVDLEAESVVACPPP